MTATMEVTSVSCPKCGGEMYDNRLTKKNPKQPDWKCKRYKEGCEGVIWPPKSAPPKPSSPKTQLPQARSYGTPEFLPTEGEEQAELAAKIGPDLTRAEAIAGKQRLYSAAMKQAVAYTLDQIEPLYRRANIGLTGDEAYKHAFSIYATWCDKGLVE